METTVGDSKSDAKPTLLTRTVKSVGRLLGPTTKTGKAFGFVEQNLTRAVDRLGQSETYLDMIGKSLSQNFRARVKASSYQEGLVHMLQLPTASEVSALRKDVRTLHDQMEALTTQLEIVLTSIEKKQSAPNAKSDKEEQSQ